MTRAIAIASLAALAANAQSIAPAQTAAGTPEVPVKIESHTEELESNGLYRLMRTTFVFTNPNSRQISADLEFPVPEGATVCGYALEINGNMVPGVICPKEKARVAFESEKARNVDPGIVEQVTRNIWRTRIFPLIKDTPRKASVDYIEPVQNGADSTIYESDGEYIYAGVRSANISEISLAEKISAFKSGAIVWDASSSAESKAALWQNMLASSLPENGDWQLVTFRNDAARISFTSKADLLDAISKIVYDGGTDIQLALDFAGNVPTLLFTDELDTLGLSAPDYETRSNVIIASRGEPASRLIHVRRFAKDEKLPDGVTTVKDSKLLGIAWAADRIKDLSSQADARKDEFLELGRRYGVASPVTSLIVLETLDQYIRQKIEPPKTLSFHDDWVRQMSARDDAIERAKDDAEHKMELLALWNERVQWWLNPIPKKPTPKSGVFDGLAAPAAAGDARLSDNAVEIAEEADAIDEEVVEERSARAGMPAPAMMRSAMTVSGAATSPRAKNASSNRASALTGGATVKIAAWDPKATYIDAIAKADDHYQAYLQEKKTHGEAPAFYMDAASWFFKHDSKALACRIISNMAEFKLEDAAIWRSMAWRLREAGEYPLAIRCLSKARALRPEEGRSCRDLALVLAESGKLTKSRFQIEAALRLFKDAAFINWQRRSARRSNDRQVAIIALEELNALISWCRDSSFEADIPELDDVFLRDMPLKIRIVLSWDADETDIDIHVLEPDGEEAFYGHRRTSSGGFVSEDVTTGYGPEEYLRKEGSGTFKIATNYFSSHQTALTGAVTATATVYTDWGTKAEQMKILTLRLDKPKDKQTIGEINIEAQAE